jgi:hypothetical protein
MTLIGVVIGQFSSSLMGIVTKQEPLGDKPFPSWVKIENREQLINATSAAKPNCQILRLTLPTG